MKNRIKRLICAAMAAVTIGTASVPAFAEDNVIEGTFSFIRPFSTEAATDKFYYSDDFFAESSTKQSDSLVTMSMVLSLSTMAIEDSSFVKKLFDDIGYKDVCVDDLDITPTRDTIGTAIAHKKVGSKTIVALAVRGDKYGAEWASNLTCGSCGNVEGLDKASMIVLERLKKYIADHDLKNVKLWITGYSRGGSTADLLGVYINEHINEFPTTAEDIYVYTFEAPNCCESSKVYDNIYCVKSKNDIITYVYPEAWGLHTNGREIYIDDEQTVKKVKIDLLDKDHVVVLGEMPMDEFLDELMTFFTDNLNREMFSGELDDSLADIIELYYSKPAEEWQKTADFIKNGLLENAMDDQRLMHVILSEGIGGVALHNSDKMYRQFTDELLLAVNELASPQELGLTDQEYKTICENLYPVLRGFGPMIIKDFMYREGIDYSAVLPGNYNDPDYDPQSSDDPVLTYDQYQRKLEEEEQNEQDERSDLEKGSNDGYYAGYDKGYSDGKAGAERIKEAPLPDDADKRSQDYLKAYADSFMRYYRMGYEDGMEADDTQEKSAEYYDGFADGDEQALEAAKKDAFTQSYKENYNAEPLQGETAYSADYIEGYKDGYAEAYDRYYQNYIDYYKELTFYHLGTFIANFENIITVHYPMTTWGRIKAWDPYYSKSGSNESDSDSGSRQENSKLSDTDTSKTSNEQGKQTSSAQAANTAAAQTAQTAAAPASDNAVATGEDQAAAYIILLMILSASAAVCCTRTKEE